MIQSMLELNLLQTEKWPSHSFEIPQYQAHRGNCENGAQENTLESLKNAKRLGFKMAEFDVLLSRDRIPVLFHDVNLGRLAKKNINADQLNFEDLRRLANVSSLKEVLLHSEVPDYLNIEIKSAAFLKDALAEKVCELIQETKSESRVLISSFNPWCLLKIKFLLPQVPIAMLASPERVKRNYVYLRRMWTAPFLRPHLLHLDNDMLDESFLKLIRTNNLRVAAWTVNDKDRAQYLLNSGVISIITDKKLI